MSSLEVDTYLAGVQQPHRRTLEALRATLRGLLPDAEEGLSYGVPCLKIDGDGVAGFAAYAQHCSYFPMSGSVLATVADQVSAYTTSKGALQFAIDTSLPASLVRVLVSARQEEIAAKRAAARRKHRRT